MLEIKQTSVGSKTPLLQFKYNSPLGEFECVCVLGGRLRVSEWKCCSAKEKRRIKHSLICVGTVYLHNHIVGSPLHFLRLKRSLYYVNNNFFRVFFL